MQLPVAPLAIAIPLLLSATVFALAYRGFRLRGTLSLIESLFTGFAAALAVLVLVVASTYTFATLRQLQASNWLIVVPFLVYALVLGTLTRRFRLSIASILLAGSIGLAPLCFVGFYAWLLAACSFGDCI